MIATIAEVEAKLRAAMDAAVTRSVRISDGLTCNFDKDGRPVECCATGSLLLDAPRGWSWFERMSFMAEELSTTTGVVQRIQSGFDGNSGGGESNDLGRRLRADYLETP